MGVAAIAVPIVLHLLARREPRRVTFPSIHFLTKRYESTRSRLQVRRWWLLALRIAAVAALAFALARPAIDRSVSVTWITIGLLVALGIVLLVLASIAFARGMNRKLGGALAAAAAAILLGGTVWAGYTYASGPSVAIDEVSPIALAIILDNGPTSAWKTAEDDRLARMKQIADWIITQLPRTSRVSIVDRSAQAVAFSLDVASAISKVDQVKSLQVTQPIASRLDLAARLLRTSDLSNRQIFVITDLNQATWDRDHSDSGFLGSLSDSPPINVNVFDLGEFTGANRSLSIPHLADPTPAKGVPTSISVILNYANGHTTSTSGEGANSAAMIDRERQVTAELRMYEADPALPMVRDGEVVRPSLRNVDRTSVQVTSGSSHELVLTAPPLEVGTHHGQIRLTGDDPLALDDVRYFTLQVLPSSSVLLVGDNPNEMRAMGLTMTAPMQMDDPEAEFSVQRITSADLPVVQVDEFDAVVLLDPTRETLRDASLLEYVRTGGGLLVCLGASAGNEPLRDAEIIKLVRRWRVPDPGTFFQVDQSNHAALATLANMPGGVPWNEYRVLQYWEVASEAAPMSGEASSGSRIVDTVLMRFAGTDHPAILERRFTAPTGQARTDPAARLPGRCLIVTTPLPDLASPQTRWNDLYGSDAWPAFILVRQLVDYVTARGGDGVNERVGQPLLMPLATAEDKVSESGGNESSTAALVAEPSEQRRLQLFPPGNTPPVPLSVGRDAEQVIIPEVNTAGTWWLRGDRPGAGFSVNLPLEQTATQRVEPSRLDQWFGTERYQIVTDHQQVELTAADSAARIELHSPFMLLALFVFLLEQILSNRFYPSRGTLSTASTPVTGTGSSRFASSSPKGVGLS